MEEDLYDRHIAYTYRKLSPNGKAEDRLSSGQDLDIKWSKCCTGIDSTTAETQPTRGCQFGTNYISLGRC